MNTPDTIRYKVRLSAVQGKCMEDAARLYMDVLSGKIDAVADELIWDQTAYVYEAQQPTVEVMEARNLDYLKGELFKHRAHATGLQGQNIHSIRSENLTEEARIAADLYFSLRSKREFVDYGIKEKESTSYSREPALSVEYKGREEGGVYVDSDIYELELSPEMMRVASTACEFLSRIHIGQLDEITFLLKRHARGEPEAYNRLNALSDILRSLTPYASGLRDNHAWGIHHGQVAEKARIAYDIEQVLRHRLAWDRKPEGGITVDFDEPSRSSKAEELPVVFVEGETEVVNRKRKPRGLDF